MSRHTDTELRAARLSLNTPDGFAISKDVIASLIDEVLELRDWVRKNGWSNLKDPRMPKMGEP